MQLPEWEGAAWGAAAVVVSIGFAFGLRAYLRSRPTLAELERRRRAMLQRGGKLGDGTILEVSDSHVFYSYEVRGVQYTATQEFSTLLDLMPPERWIVIGPASVKYDPRNPANSIVLSESWTGLRQGQPRS
jgi:hypothetical protein